MSTTDRRAEFAPDVSDRARNRLGAVALVVCVAASAVWLTWRASQLGAHLVEVSVFAAEVVSLMSGLVVGLAMVRSTEPRAVFDNDPRDSFRFAFGVADVIGRTRAGDLRMDMAASGRSIRRRGSDLSDVAILALLTDGPRRLLLVSSLTLALLLGVSPLPVPPVWAIVCGATAFAALSVSHVLLGGGRIRFGDRVRWSSAALGEVLSAADREGVAPRRWVGTVAAVVVLNLAIALRGMSDRWTHGLAPMAGDERYVTMLVALTLVAGSLYTLRTTTAPQLANAHLVSRHTEERTARQSALGGAVLIGLVGLVAGVMPSDVDAADDIPAGVEQIID